MPYRTLFNQCRIRQRGCYYLVKPKMGVLCALCVFAVKFEPQRRKGNTRKIRLNKVRGA